VHIGYAELKVRAIRGKKSSFRAMRGTLLLFLLSFSLDFPPLLIELLIYSLFSFANLQSTIVNNAYFCDLNFVEDGKE